MDSEPSYEDVAYPGGAFPAMHPDWLASVAWLHGLPVPDVAKARAIEFGCGDGGTLIPLAVALPGARFFGMDRSPAHIARANARVAALGLANIAFAVGDLTTFDAGGERYDVALAHGVYSWVPAAPRAALLKLYGTLLTENGVGYLSFAAYPGGHLDQVLYDMACMHAARHTGGREKVAAARRLARALLDTVPPDDLVWAVLRRDLQRLETWPDGTIAHDAISESNQRVWLHEMVAQLDAVGLQHVADAALLPAIELRAPKTKAFMDLGGDDPVMRAQYLDMLRLARFRQIVVARKGTAPAASPLPERMRTVKLRATLRAKTDEIALTRGVPVDFASNRGLEFTVDEPMAKAALLAIGSARPRALALDELATMSAQVLRAAGLEREIEPDPQAYLASTLADLIGYKALLAGLADPALAAAPGDRPVVSPLARLQLAAGEQPVNLWLESFRMDAQGTRIIPLLDGTRDRAALSAASGLAPADLDTVLGALHREAFLVG